MLLALKRFPALPAQRRGQAEPLHCRPRHVYTHTPPNMQPHACRAQRITALRVIPRNHALRPCKTGAREAISPRQHAFSVASAAPRAIMSLSALLRQSGDAAAALASSAQSHGERARSADPPTLRHAPSLNDFSLGYGAELHAQDGAWVV